MLPIDEDTVADFIQSRFGLHGIMIDREVARWFHHLTGGIPFYFQKLGHICFQELMFHKKIELPKIK